MKLHLRIIFRYLPARPCFETQFANRFCIDDYETDVNLFKYDIDNIPLRSDFFKLPYIKQLDSSEILAP